MLHIFLPMAKLLPVWLRVSTLLCKTVNFNESNLHNTHIILLETLVGIKIWQLEPKSPGLFTDLFFAAWYGITIIMQIWIWWLQRQTCTANNSKHGNNIKWILTAYTYQFCNKCNRRHDEGLVLIQGKLLSINGNNHFKRFNNTIQINTDGQCQISIGLYHTGLICLAA